MPHLALTIPEIFLEILENLRKAEHSYFPRPDSPRDLLSTALCCRAFKDLSLDILWDTLPEIAPLLKLIPGMQDLNGQMVISPSNALSRSD
jgi:hypothetical protein